MKKFPSYSTASQSYKEWIKAETKIAKLEERALNDELQLSEKKEREIAMVEDKRDEEIKIIMREKLSAIEKEGTTIHPKELLELAIQEMEKREKQEEMIHDVLSLAKQMRTIQRKPAEATLEYAHRLCKEYKKDDILLSVYDASFDGKAIIGVFTDNEGDYKCLVEVSDSSFSYIDDDAFISSIIQKIFRSGTDLIILTENSVYITSDKIMKRKCS